MNHKKQQPICVFCGQRPGITRDHVPPKGIFARPLPKDLITVPACKECNGAASGLDERFRVNLGLQVSTSSAMGEHFFRSEAIRTLEKNQKLRRAVLLKLFKGCPVAQVEPGGVRYIGHSAQWDSEAHDAVVERTIRGLYYHHFRKILGDRVGIQVYWRPRLEPELVQILNDCRVNIIGRGEVIYRYGYAVESPLYSLWMLQFYGAHWAAGVTVPKDG